MTAGNRDSLKPWQPETVTIRNRDGRKPWPEIHQLREIVKRKPAEATCEHKFMLPRQPKTNKKHPSQQTHVISTVLALGRPAVRWGPRHIKKPMSEQNCNAHNRWAGTLWLEMLDLPGTLVCVSV